jgi:meso-butanediol dehydrogenase / (S,S)-butanediol dehydrogenase / diacetyl reductase
MSKKSTFTEWVLPERHAGKRAFVTGAGSGIGRAVAHRLAAEGAHVWCADLKGADETASAITAAGGRADSATLDVTDAASVESCVNDAATAMGGLDIACNIAGIGHFAWTHEESPEWFDRIISVNVNGTFYVTRYALPHLMATGNGVIVNTSSTAGIFGQPWSAAYCASKGAVSMMTKAVATEYRGKGVRCVAVAPGGTNTNIVQSFMSIPEGANPKEMSKMMSPMGTSEPEEMASAFSYLASDEARYVTGVVFAVDGGLTA